MQETLALAPFGSCSVRHNSVTPPFFLGDLDSMLHAFLANVQNACQVSSSNTGDATLQWYPDN